MKHVRQQVNQLKVQLFQLLGSEDEGEDPVEVEGHAVRLQGLNDERDGGFNEGRILTGTSNYSKQSPK